MTSTGPPPAALSSLLTVIITTSPTPSAPSTDLLSSVLLSFRQHCPGLVCCRVIVVFDTYDRIEAKARLKRGTVTAEGARNFALYRDNVKELILREYQPERDPDQALTQDDGVAEYGLSGDWNNVSLKISHTHDKWVTFIEPTQRLGFGLAVRSALRLTSTPYVWIHQHDWTLISDIPLQAMLQVMQASSAEAASEAAPPPPPPPPPPQTIQMHPTTTTTTTTTSKVHLPPLGAHGLVRRVAARDILPGAAPPDGVAAARLLRVRHDDTADAAVLLARQAARRVGGPLPRARVPVAPGHAEGRLHRGHGRAPREGPDEGRGVGEVGLLAVLPRRGAEVVLEAS